MEKPISSYSLKVSGAFELPQAVEAQDYEVKITGSVVSRKFVDNNDGTETLEYTFKPYSGEVVDELGKTIKLKDKRRDSVKLRNMIEGLRQDQYADQDEEEFYARFHQGLRANFDEVARIIKMQKMKTEIAVAVRNDAMLREYRSGKTLEQIAGAFGITRQRVQQILSRKREYVELEKGNSSLRSKPLISKPCGWHKCNGKVIYRVGGMPRSFCSSKCYFLSKDFEYQQMLASGKKTCTKCRELKPLSSFFKRKRPVKLKYGTAEKWYSHCRNCHTMLTREWAKRNPQRAREINAAAQKRYLSNPKNRKRRERLVRERSVCAITGGGSGKTRNGLKGSARKTLGGK